MQVGSLGALQCKLVSFFDPSLNLTMSRSQQAVSALTNLPDDMFQGSGQKFTTLGMHHAFTLCGCSDSLTQALSTGRIPTTLRKVLSHGNLMESQTTVSVRVLSVLIKETMVQASVRGVSLRNPW